MSDLHDIGTACARYGRRGAAEGSDRTRHPALPCPVERPSGTQQPVIFSDGIPSGNLT